MRVEFIRSDNFLSLLLKGLILLGSISWVVLFYISLVGHRNEQMGQMFVAGTFALGITALIFLRPQFGAYILIVTTYTYISTILTNRGFPSIYKMLLVLVLITLVAYYLVGRKTTIPLPGRFEWILVIYIVVQMISATFARDHDAAQTAIEDQVRT
jgi:hypothetical protein